jgi:8-oxo-dGTP diphosphatase
MEATPTDWSNWQPQLRATLMFILDEAEQKVLLIRKKRGLGAGKINGPGGKLDPGESSVQCAVRETQEELHVTALAPQKRGELWFQFTDGLGMIVDVFLSRAWSGTPTETEEAIPLWTSVHELPLDEMWADDALWLYRVLTTQDEFVGKFDFDAERMLTGDIVWAENSCQPERSLAGV